MCSCAKKAIENYIRFRLADKPPTFTDRTRMFILDSRDFPRALVEELIKKGVPYDAKVISYLIFKDKLCHECNRVVPKYRYCHEMYGGTFVQNYGWYIKKEAYELGVDFKTGRILLDVCPQEIVNLIEVDPVESPKYVQELLKVNPNKAKELREKLTQQRRAIWNFIENRVREKFGYKKIGEEWTNETMLYHIVKSFLPDMTIIRHYRPKFLNGLELDIFIKELRVGIEYQGIQHFKAVEHWGGITALNELKGRDKRKYEICTSLGIPIVYFRYDEDLNDELVRIKLGKYIKKP